MDADPRQARTRDDRAEPGQTSRRRGASAVAAQPAALAEFQGQPARLLVALDLPRPVRRCRCSPSSSPTTGRSSSPTRARSCFRSSSTIRRRNSAASSPSPTTAIPFIQDEIKANGWMVWPPIRYSYRTVNNEIAEAGAGAAVVAADARRSAARAIRTASTTRNCTLGNWNWLGTDDQGRDVRRAR